MLQLTYISTATRDLPDSAIREILASARRRNAADNITGLLMYDGCRFLQTLEGHVNVIEETYARIRRDSRHRALVLLSSNDVACRSFGNWAMAAARISNIADGNSVIDQVDQLTAAVGDRNLREHFRGFARVRAAA